MENSNWILWVLGAVALGGTVYFLSKKRDKKQLILADDMDRLTLHFVDDYFQKTLDLSTKEKNLNIKPALVKMDGKLFQNNSPEHIFFGLVYYNMDTKSIVDDNAKFIRTKSIDVNLKDTLGEEDILIYE